MATAFSDKIRIRLKAYDYRVLDRRSVEYPNISESGTRALMICVPPRSSCD